jgi:MoaA/NifB/PqqE/SkfB family radical SAM enzyme
MTWNKDVCVQLYDGIADQVNDSFPAFMETAFHIPRDMGAVIRGGRELVASKGLFITKKRYAVLYYDKENKRTDINGKPGKVKVMGLDLKRSDTPKVIQDFLSDVLNDVLTGAEKDAVIEKIKEFKYVFKERPGWEKGTPKRVNNLTKFVKAEEREGKTNMPGHVRAAMNWNTMRRMHSDNYSIAIVDGMSAPATKSGYAQIYIDSSGLAYPCCYVAGNVFLLEGLNVKINDGWNDIWTDENKDKINLYKNDISDVVNNEFFLKIKDSWNKSYKSGKLAICSASCSKADGRLIKPDDFIDYQKESLI